MMTTLLRKVGAELIGTFALVTAGCGAIIVDFQTGALTHLGVALTFGLTIAVMIAAMGHISGGHFNPAVTLGLATTRHFPWKEVPFYLFGQFLGATLAATTLVGFFGKEAVRMSVNGPGAHISALQATGVEVVLTAFLVFVITAVATDPQSIGKLAGFAIGATITLDALWGGPLTGASMNPARSFGPALLSGDWTSLWVYFVGPIIGGLIGAVLFQLIRHPSATEQAEKAEQAVTVTVPASEPSNG